MLFYISGMVRSVLMPSKSWLRASLNIFIQVHVPPMTICSNRLTCHSPYVAPFSWGFPSRAEIYGEALMWSLFSLAEVLDFTPIHT
jgi:hypothetical protein